MISRISGTITAVESDRIVIQTVSGLGYDVLVPPSVLQTVPAPGGPIDLVTVLIVREDSLALYGFVSERDRAIFQRLLSTSGVGPRLALTLLSSLGTRRLIRSLQERDIAALTTVPGIGKKTAERLSIEMGDRLKDLDLEDDVSREQASGTFLAADALVQLGYSRAQADDAVRRALAEGTRAESPEELIRHSLQLLGSG